MIDIDFNKYEVVFAPETLEEEVIQNVRSLLGNLFFSVPYMREFGLEGDALDAPIPFSQMKLRADIAEKMKYEPRAKLVETIFQGDAINGYTKPIVRISLND
jgi:uncharacterized protein